jgi:RNA polymerase primary sigma factor
MTEMENAYNKFKLYLLKNQININDEELFNDFFAFYSQYGFLNDDYDRLLDEFFMSKHSDLFGELNTTFRIFVKSLGNDNLTIINEVINKYYNGKINILYFISNLVNALSLDVSKDEIIELIKNNPSIKRILDGAFSKKKQININELTTPDNLVNMFYEIYAEMYDINIVFDDEDSVLLEPGDDTYISSLTEYLYEVKQEPRLSKQELNELILKAQNGDLNARNRVVSANLRLVVHLAKRYNNRGLDYLDLIQEGNIGLMKAIDMFDVSKGFTFSTYSHNWIRQGILRAISNKGKTIRIPVHTQNLLNKRDIALSMLSNKLGRSPTNQELADYLNVPKAKIDELNLYDLGVTSLDEPLKTEEEDTSVIDMTPAEVDPEMQDLKFLRADLLKLLNQELSDKEKTVLLYRTGFYDNKQYTLEEIGSKFGVTRERIRQVEKKALLKLRSNDVKEELSSYYYHDNFLQSFNMKNLFFYVSFLNVDELNLFISMLSTNELKIFKKVFDKTTLEATNYGLVKGDYETLINFINFFNDYLSLIRKADNLTILYELINSPGTFNIFNYLNTRDKYAIEEILSSNADEFNNLSINCINFNNGKLSNKINRNQALNIVKLIKLINKKDRLNHFPKRVMIGL